jgi:CRP/FNR family transcriptional regulator, cyclic AMP receptor protein
MAGDDARVFGGQNGQSVVYDFGVYPDLGDAARASHFRGLPPEVLDELFDGAGRSKIAAGSVAHWALDDDPYVEMVITGVIRVFVTAPDGRTMTIRYCRSGELLGAMSLFSDQFTEPATKQALVDTELLVMSPSKVRALAQRDLRVAQALLVELSERARCFVNEIPGTAFATVRQRVARQLLDLASNSQQDPQPDRELAVQITQQDLAAAAGTVREVVVRALRQLRDTGAIRTERDRIVLLDPAQLTEEVKWNTSR